MLARTAKPAAKPAAKATATPTKNEIKISKVAPSGEYKYVRGPSLILRFLLQPCLCNLCDLFVILGNAKHDLFGATVFHIVRDCADFLRARTPITWIIDMCWQFRIRHSVARFILACGCRPQNRDRNLGPSRGVTLT